MKKLLIVALLSGTVACAATDDRPTHPSGRDARTGCPVHTGVVLDVIQVTLEGETNTARGIGGALGGYAGNQATKNSGSLERLGGSLAGAVAGVALGDVVSNVVLDRSGTELIIDVGGEALSVLQQTDSDVQFQTGDAVWVIGHNAQRRNACKNGIRVLPKERS